MNRIVLLIAVLAAPITFAQDSPDEGTITKVGTTAAQFLKLGMSARAISMGSAFVAEASDLSAVYWNPAGLASLQGGAVQVSHTEYLAGIDYEVAAFGTSLGRNGALGASVIFLDSGDMEVRTVDAPDGTGEQFGVQNVALQLSYARALTDRFSLGVTGKYIREAIWHSSASALGLDIGILFTTPFDGVRLGASIANFGPKMQMDGRDIIFSEDPDPRQSGNVDVVNARYLLDEHDLPLLFRFGLAWDALDTADHRLVVLTDAAQPNDNSQYMSFGSEYAFRDLVMLRAGYRNAFETDGEQGLTFGGGLQVRLDRSLAARFDYAYADFGRLDQTHWFTVDLSF